MSHNITKEIYINSITPTPSMIPSFSTSNNNPTIIPLMTVWVIIQIFLFLCFSFFIMCIIAYIVRVKLVRDIRRQQGINLVNSS